MKRKTEDESAILVLLTNKMKKTENYSLIVLMISWSNPDVNILENKSFY